MEMRDSLIGGRMRMDAEGTVQAQAQAAALPPAQGAPARQPFASASSAGSVARRVGRAVSMMFSRGDELRPYQSCSQHLKEIIPFSIIALVIVCIVATVCVAIFAQPEFELMAQGSPCVAAGPLGANCTLQAGSSFSGDCVFGLTQHIDGQKKCPLEKAEYTMAAPKWKAYFVMNGIVFTIGAIFMGAPVAPTILVTNVVFVSTKIVTEKEAFAGFGSPGIVALAILFVLAAAVERSGLLEPLIDALMGDGSNPGMSRVRLIVPTMIMSGFVSNTPICAMIMPFAINWAERRGLEPFDYLMPLAFAANIGGTISQIGSPPNLVVFERLSKNYVMGMFYQAPVAILCCAAFALFTYALGPWLLCASVRPEAVEPSNKAEGELYGVRWVVMDDSELVGTSWRGRGLLRLQNTRLQSILRRRGTGDAMEAPSDLAGWELAPGDEIVALSDAGDVARLRHVRGLLLSGDAGEAVRRLGANRRKRCLFEAVFRAGVDASKLAPGQENVDLRVGLLTAYKAALIAYRGPAQEESGQTAKGRIALIEAEEGGFEAKADKAFALVRKVPGTTPPRVGRHADPIRAWVSMGIVLTVILLCILVSIPSLGLGEKWMTTAPLASLAVIAAALIVAIDILTLKEALNSINVQAYIGIAASMGMGKALETTGVARMVAGSLVAMAKAAGCGAIGTSAAMFAGACMLSNVVTNTAVAVLVMPIAESIAAEEGIDVRILGALVILASNFALATPFACATNLMVMAPLGPGKQSYSFGDYIRFGVPLQITLFVTAIIGVKLFYGPLETAV